MSRKAAKPNFEIEFSMEDGKPFDVTRSNIDIEFTEFQVSYIHKQLESITDTNKRLQLYNKLLILMETGPNLD